MMNIGNRRVKGITIQIRDDCSKKSKSFTVHGLSLNKLYYRLMFYVEKLTKHDIVTMVCHKRNLKGETDNDKTID